MAINRQQYRQPAAAAEVKQVAGDEQCQPALLLRPGHGQKCGDPQSLAKGGGAGGCYVQKVDDKVVALGRKAFGCLGALSRATGIDDLDYCPIRSEDVRATRSRDARTKSRESSGSAQVHSSSKTHSHRLTGSPSRRVVCWLSLANGQRTGRGLGRGRASRPGRAAKRLR